jgi:quinol monooxygenase YgiN
MNNNLIVMAENDIHDGQIETLKALLGEIIDSVERSEPGTLNYEWFIADDGKSVHVYERYADADACVLHLMKLGETYAQRLFACLTCTKIAVYGTPNDAVREIFTPFAPAYIRRFAGVAR